MTATEACITKEAKGLSVFEKYLSVWVILCIIAGIVLGRIAPGVAQFLDGLAIYVNEAPVVSIPIAICLFFMMYPIMVKIDFAEVLRAGKSVKPVGLTLFVNWAVKPFTMYAISLLFLGSLFLAFVGPDAVDYVKMPLGLDLPEGATHGAGKVVMIKGIKMLEVPLWRSYLAGCILLGIAPCTAMVLVWGFLAKGMTATRWLWWQSTRLPCCFSVGLSGASSSGSVAFPFHGRLCFFQSEYTLLCPWSPGISPENSSFRPRESSGSEKIFFTYLHL